MKVLSSQASWIAQGNSWKRCSNESRSRDKSSFANLELHQEHGLQEALSVILPSPWRVVLTDRIECFQPAASPLRHQGRQITHHKRHHLHLECRCVFPIWLLGVTGGRVKGMRSHFLVRAVTLVSMSTTCPAQHSLQNIVEASQTIQVMTLHL